MQKLSIGVVSALELLALPLLYQSFAWSWQLVCGCLMAVGIAVARQQTPWALVASACFAVLASSGHWVLLPLMLAQVGLAWLLDTQTMSPAMAESLWLVQVAFVQVALLTRAQQVLTIAVLVCLLITLLPVMVMIWADRVPVWAAIGALVVIAGIGFLSRQAPLTYIALAVILPAATSTRFVKLNPLINAAMGLGLGLLLVGLRLHG